MTASAAALFAESTLLQAVDTTDPVQTDLWQRCELAIFAEHRLATVIDPRALNADAFKRLCRQALASKEALSDITENTFFHPFWVVESGHIAGMVAFTLVTHTHRPFIQIWDFYLLPAFRCQGLGRAVLDTISATAVTYSYNGFRLSTEWLYQSAARYYLRQGLWLTGWKRHLDFARYPSLPDFRCELKDDSAQFLLLSKAKNRRTLLYSARRNDPFLELETTPFAQRLSAEHGILPHYALSTFSLWLALNGWPLVRSPEAWDDRFNYSDGGMPEGLAYKIELFEAWARDQGFTVRTPRIPGLLYRDWRTLIKG